VRVACAAVALLLVPDLFRVARAAVRRLRVRPSRAELLWGAMLLVYLSFLAARAVVVGDMGDDDGYHLAAPRRWLESGALVYLPTLTHTSSCMGLEMLYLLALGVQGPIAAKMIHFDAGLFVLLGVFCAARRLSGTRVALAAVSLLLVPTPFDELPSLISLAYNDLGVAWMLIAGLLFWLPSKGDFRLRACAALCAGFAASFKLTALCMCAAFPAVFLLEDARRDLRRGLRQAVGCGLVAALPVLPWFARNAIQTGNPVYPLFSGLIPTRDWNPDLARAFSLFFRYYNWAKRFAGQWSLDRRALVLACAAAVILAACLVTLWRAKRPEIRSLVLLATLLLGTALWSTGLYFRFWLPALICLLLAVAAALGPRSSRFWVPAATALLAAGLLLRVRNEEGGMSAFRRHFRVALGLDGLDDAYSHSYVWDTWKYINAHTEPGAHILIAAFYPTFGASSGGGFWVDRPVYVTDSQLQGFIHLDSWPSFLRSIAAARIEYVLISDELPNAGRLGFSFRESANEYRFCRRLVEEYGERVRTDGHLQLYRLRSLDFY
jgi:hypothetical protein